MSAYHSEADMYDVRNTIRHNKKIIMAVIKINDIDRPMVESEFFFENIGYIIIITACTM